MGTVPDGKSRNGGSKIAALLAAGWAAHRSGDRMAALESFQAVLSIDPSHFEASLDAAVQLTELSRWDEAEALCTSMLERFPGNAAPLLCFARIKRRRGDLQAALTHLDSALAIEPADVWTRVERANVLSGQLRANEAETEFRRILGETPGQIGALFGLARLARQRGDYAAALAHFELLLAIDPGNLGARIEVANVLADTSRGPEAEAAFRRTLEATPSHVGALAGLARVLRQRGDLGGALKQLEAAAAAEPGNVWVRLDLARVEAELGEVAIAEARVQELIAVQPEQGAVWAVLGQLRRETGRHELALQAFREGAMREPWLAQLWVDVGIEERTLGRPQLSHDALLHALELEPGHLAALLQLAEHERMGERFERAVETAERAVAAHPSSVRARIVLARMRAALGDAKAAEEELDSADAVLGPDPGIDLLRVHFALEAGRLDQARATLVACRDRSTAHAGLIAESVRLAIREGDLDEATARVALLTGTAVTDRIRAHMLRGIIARERWDLNSARSEFQSALKINPSDSSAHWEMARMCMLAFDLDAAGSHLAAMHRAQIAARISQGRSLNVSQQFLGQLLDEFRLDQELAKSLRSLAALPPEVRLKSLQKLVLDHPGTTSTAIASLVSLREASLFRRPTPVSNKPNFLIPNRIVQFWSDSSPPTDIAELMDSWQHHNPAWEYERFDDAAARVFLAEHFVPQVLSAYRRAQSPAMRADLFRLAYLFARGGLYADADDRCLKPLQGIVSPGATLLCYQEEYGTIGTNILACAPGESVIGRAFASAIAAINRGDQDLLWLCTGPGLITRAFAQTWALAADEAREWLKNRFVLSRSEISAFVAAHCRVRYKVENHWSRTALASRARSAAFSTASAPIRTGGAAISPTFSDGDRGTISGGKFSEL